MSAKSSTVLVLAGGVFLIRFLQKGKLGNAWTAIWSSPPESGGTGSGGSGGGIPPEPGPTPSGSGPAFPNRSLFGIPVPSWLSHGESFSTDQTLEARIVAGDQALLSGAGGGKFFSDFDYGIPSGSSVKLPGPSSQKYRLVRNYFSPLVGWMQAWAPLSSTGQQLPGIFSYVHLSSDTLHQGTIHHGGEIAGLSGQPLSSTYGSGEHLAVVTDQPGYNFLQSLGWS